MDQVFRISAPTPATPEFNLALNWPVYAGLSGSIPTPNPIHPACTSYKYYRFALVPSKFPGSSGGRGIQKTLHIFIALQIFCETSNQHFIRSIAGRILDPAIKLFKSTLSIFPQKEDLLLVVMDLLRLLLRLLRFDAHTSRPAANDVLKQKLHWDLITMRQLFLSLILSLRYQRMHENSMFCHALLCASASECFKRATNCSRIREKHFNMSFRVSSEATHVSFSQGQTRLIKSPKKQNWACLCLQSSILMQDADSAERIRPQLLETKGTPQNKIQRHPLHQIEQNAMSHCVTPYQTECLRPTPLAVLNKISHRRLKGKHLMVIWGLKTSSGQPNQSPIPNLKFRFFYQFQTVSNQHFKHSPVAVILIVSTKHKFHNFIPYNFQQASTVERSSPVAAECTNTRWVAIVWKLLCLQYFAAMFSASSLLKIAKLSLSLSTGFSLHFSNLVSTSS